MTFEAGQMLGGYALVSFIGKGSMGEVWRARDPRLGRDVAVKALAPRLAEDQEKLDRFEREAKLLASLDHPGIATIHGIEMAGDVRFLVLELVEGETLADRIRRSPLPMEEALDLSLQIAEALEAAHDRGVIHRDLKPSNIKITPGGRVKILDFGLAKPFPLKAVEAVDSVTLSIATTEQGLIIGTGPYMSPEQAKGQECDFTADIWAFGCVLYEMLTGRRAFEGETVSEVLAAVLKAEPDWSALPSDTPAGVRRLLERCLRKDRKQRLHHVADARIELEEARDRVEAAPERRPAPAAWSWAGWAAAALIAIAAALFFLLGGVPEESGPVLRVDIVTPPTTDPRSIAISPDGRRIVFQATVEGRTSLWMRSLDSASHRMLNGTGGAAFPFWSPDSRFVAFFADGQLKRLDVTTGAVQTVAPAPAGRGGTWSRDGVIVFAGNLAGPLSRVSAAGGEGHTLTTLSQDEQSHRFPSFLPDGRRFLYYVTGVPEIRGVYVGSLDGAPPRFLLPSDSAALFSPTGHLLFVRQGALFAQRFDAERLALEGAPTPIAEGMIVDADLAALSVSASGAIVYRTSTAAGPRQLAWFNREGAMLETIGVSDPAEAVNPSLSPEGNRVALQRTVNGNVDVWLLDLARGVLSRLTYNAYAESSPVWSPDGSRVIYNGRPGLAYDLYVQSATAAGPAELLLSSEANKSPTDWSPDGRTVLFRSPDALLGWDIWMLDLEGGGEAAPLIQTSFDERDAQFAPNGRFIAYQSNETGRFEVYVQPFPGPGGRWQISNRGGAQPRWSSAGDEVFYIDLEGRLMSARINLEGSSVEIQPPMPLFTTQIGGAIQGIFRQQYMVAPGGQRFLMNMVGEGSGMAPLTMLLNWAGE